MIDFEDQKENARLHLGYTIQRTDPFGFWIVLDAKGRRVKGLESVYTNTASAAKAVTAFTENKPKGKI